MKSLDCLFILHPNRDSISNQVRAKIYEHFNVKIINLTGDFKPKIYYFPAMLINLVINLIYLSINKKKFKRVILIKPWSLFIFFFLKIIFKKKLFIDINDPLHLDYFLGEKKFNLLLKFSSGNLIFESLEYYEYCKKKYHISGYLIDDYSQIQDFPKVKWEKKIKRLIWFGDSINSYQLTLFLPFFKKLNSRNYELCFFGLSERTENFLKHNGVIFSHLKYMSRNSFLNFIANTKFVFIPFSSKNRLHTLRGNLKLKFSMASGACVIAKNIKMHKRLIGSNKNGLFFNNLQDLMKVFRFIEKNDCEEISANAIKKIMQLGDTTSYFKKYLSLPEY